MALSMNELAGQEIPESSRESSSEEAENSSDQAEEPLEVLGPAIQSSGQYLWKLGRRTQIL